jgi:hypothetical protein
MSARIALAVSLLTFALAPAPADSACKSTGLRRSTKRVQFLAHHDNYLHLRIRPQARARAAYFAIARAITTRWISFVPS